MKNLKARIEKLEVAKDQSVNGGIFLVFMEDGETEELALQRTLRLWGYTRPPLTGAGHTNVVYLNKDDVGLL